jgi:hypothetical protein
MFGKGGEWTGREEMGLAKGRRDIGLFNVVM